MSKTAMQEAIEMIQLARESGETDLRSIKYALEKLLKKEKQQIVDAWKERDEFYRYNSGEDYYTQTFTQ